VAPGLVLALVALLAGLGLVAMRRVPLDAVPDLSDVQVIVLTEWEGHATPLVEDQLTAPLSAGLVSTPGVQTVRGQSFFGLSFVTVIFEDGTDLYAARSRVSERLGTLQGRLPLGVAPALGPDASGVGWVLMYALKDTQGQADLAQLRAIQDWELRPQLEAVPGVAEVASLGGFERQLQVEVSPEALAARGLRLTDVEMAVRAANADAGGGVIELGGQEHMIRSRGYLRGPDELLAAPLMRAPDGATVTVGDVAEARWGPAMRRGIAELDGQGEVVGGIIVMRQGADARAVIGGVKDRLVALQASLPPGVEVVITYDRSELIDAAIHTLQGTLIEELIVVSAVILLFLLSVRSALVPILTLPVAVLIAFIPMAAQGLGANIMSLGGVAVAIGAMVDASIILVENVHKRLEEWAEAPGDRPRAAVVVGAMQEVGPSIFFSLLVITVSFLPVFSLQATEGRLFRPLAFTKTYAMGFAALLAVTLTPALVALLLRGPVRREADHPLSRRLSAAYAPVVRAVVRRPKVVVAAALALMAATVPAFLSLQREFMPPLHEGVLLYMPSSPMGMPADEASRTLQLLDRQIKAVPEVAQVFGKMGRAESATDPAPLGMAETTILLKPRDQWRPGLDWDGLVAELDAAVGLPGMPNLWWMPIQTRTEMLSTGVRSPLALQVSGRSLADIEQLSLQLEQALLSVPGTRSAQAERSTGGFTVDVDVDRARAAQLGVSVQDINDTVRMAIGGMTVGETLIGRRRYGVALRAPYDLREDLDQLGRLPVQGMGPPVPLAEVARVAPGFTAPALRSEGGRLIGNVFVDPGAGAIGSYVDRAEAALRAAVQPPEGAGWAWVGQFTAMQRAQDRLAVALPLTLALVVLLLYLNTRSLTETAIVLLAVPFSLIGAVWLLWALDYHLSVAVWVGVIALAGLDAETGVVMLLYLTLSWRERQASGAPLSPAALEEAIVDGAARRIRPKLMTVLTTFIGLAPLLWSDGAGADVMKRVAAPMVGGLFTSFCLELLVYPAVFALWKRRGLRAG
jgi:Cu(I)/Ag(I) efflux system membrane protein CusA/SilA